MREQEKPEPPVCYDISGVLITKTVIRSIVKLPAPPMWLADVHDYSNLHDAAVCSLLVTLD